MRITTKRGDKGKTRLRGGRAVSKCEPRIRVEGALDELVAFLGLAKAKIKDRTTKEMMDSIQKNIFRIMSELGKGSKRDEDFKDPINARDIKRLEELGNIIERKVVLPSNFVVPGVNERSAVLHIARTVARRAECDIVELNRKSKVDPRILAYLNRLSDFLFVLAVYEERNSDILRYGE